MRRHAVETGFRHDEANTKLKAARPDESVASWAFRWLMEFAKMLDKAPSWEELCRQREEAAERLKAERD